MINRPSANHIATTDMRDHIMGHLADDFIDGAFEGRTQYFQPEAGEYSVALLAGNVLEPDGEPSDYPFSARVMSATDMKTGEPTYVVSMIEESNPDARIINTHVLNRAAGIFMMTGSAILPLKSENYHTLRGMLNLTEYSAAETARVAKTEKSILGQIVARAQIISSEHTVESVKRAARREFWQQATTQAINALGILGASLAGTMPPRE